MAITEYDASKLFKNISGSLEIAIINFLNSVKSIHRNQLVKIKHSWEFPFKYFTLPLISSRLH